MSEPAAEPTTARLALTLGLAGVLSGLAIVGVYEWTQPIIEANRAEALKKAVFEVVPGSASFKRMVPDDGKLKPSDAEGDAVFATFDESGALVGFAVPGVAPGYADKIRLIFGYDPATDTTVGYQVLESKETPGLGDKIFKDDAFVKSFVGLAVDPNVELTKPGKSEKPNQVDSISGATISSKAVVAAINKALEQWRDLMRASRGARAEGK